MRLLTTTVGLLVFRLYFGSVRVPSVIWFDSRLTVRKLLVGFVGAQVNIKSRCCQY